MLENLLLGFQTAISLTTLWYCFLGVLLGMIIGVLPGIGSVAAISLLLPFTFNIDPISGIVMLAGVYYGGQYGGSTASILLNLPGAPSSAVTCLDGYPMAKKGKAGLALFITTIASFVGALIGLVLLVLFSPALAQAAQQFGPAELFSMMLLGLVAASTLSSGSPAKGLAMVVLGLLISMVGSDVQTGEFRFTFERPELMDGIKLVALAMGLFGIAELINSINIPHDTSLMKKKITMRSMLPTKEEWKRSSMPMLRGSAIGSFLGTLPGVGPSIASFMAYATEKKVAKHKKELGQGAIEGVSAPEAANNAAVQTAFVPSLSLGLPGDAVMAIMLGALMIHGIQPGPMLISEQPGLFWGLVISFIIGNVILLILNIPLISIWVSMLKIPFKWLFPAILIFICLGVFSEQNNYYDIYMAAIIGMVGYFLYVLKFEPAPLLLGYVLGAPMEENLRRALQLSGGDGMTFLSRPISVVFLAFAALILLWTTWSALKRIARSHERAVEHDLSHEHEHPHENQPSSAVTPQLAKQG